MGTLARDAGEKHIGRTSDSKLGIRPNEQLVVRGAPAHYAQLLPGLPEGVTITSRPRPGMSFGHLFVRQRAELERELAHLRPRLAETGTLWVSWPKKSSGVPSDVTEDTIRAVALPLGLVDVKVCAVDETWSGLKLMIRRELRKTAARL